MRKRKPQQKFKIFGINDNESTKTQKEAIKIVLREKYYPQMIIL